SEQAFQDLVDQLIQLCAATALFGPEDVQWPPVPGDHPTIHQWWGIVGYRLRRVRLYGLADEVCREGWSVSPLSFVSELAPGQIPAGVETAVVLRGENIPNEVQIQGIHINDFSVMFDEVEIVHASPTEVQ